MQELPDVLKQYKFKDRASYRKSTEADGAEPYDVLAWTWKLNLDWLRSNGALPKGTGSGP